MPCQDIIFNLYSQIGEDILRSDSLAPPNKCALSLGRRTKCVSYAT